MINAVGSTIRHFLKSEDGPTAVEYAVIIMLVFLAVLTTVQLLGGKLAASFQDSADEIDAVTGGM